MTWTILRGDAREIPLADKSVQCVITSPPYWGLRDYGTAKWEGGSEECDHKVRLDPRLEKSTLGGGKATTGHQREGYKGDCHRCGATRIDSQIGLEKTPDEYVAKMVEVFREVRRVLKDDGTLWLNLGSSYASNPAKGGSGPNGKNGYGENYGRPMRRGSGRADGIVSDESPRNRDGCIVPPGFKPKDLVPIPWMVAMALQADGWYLRSDIIWSKPNPMPESVRDRPTKSHEYIFLLSKNERYFFDQEAVKEPAIYGDPRKPYAPGQIDARGNGHDRNGGQVRETIKRESYEELAGRNDGGRHISGGFPLRESKKRGEFNGKTNAMPGREAFRSIKDWRNIRSVWTIAMQPYSEAHFATFPLELAERCVKAGSKPGDIIFDPFAGAGTTILVADKLNRHGAGLELKAEYCAMAHRRVFNDAPLLAGKV